MYPEGMTEDEMIALAIANSLQDSPSPTQQTQQQPQQYNSHAQHGTLRAMGRHSPTHNNASTAITIHNTLNSQNPDTVCIHIANGPATDNSSTVGSAESLLNTLHSSYTNLTGSLYVSLSSIISTFKPPPVPPLKHTNIDYSAASAPYSKWDVTCPAPITSMIFSYLQANELTQLAAVSRKFRKASAEDALWEQLLRTDFDYVFGYTRKAEQRNCTSGAYCKQLYRRVHYKRQQEVIRQRAQWQEELSEKRRRTFGRWFECLSEPCFLPILMCLLLVLIIQVVVALELNYSFTAAWLWTLPAFVGFVAFVICILCYTNYVYRPFPFRRGLFDGSSSVVAIVSREILPSSSVRAQSSFCFMLSSLGTFVIFLFLRLCAYVTWSWAFVFLPLFVAFFMWCIFPMCRWGGYSRSDNVEACFVAWVLLLAPLLTFFIMLVLRLEGSELRMDFIFIPLWVIDGFIFCAAVFGTRNEGAVVMCVWFCTLSPLIVFKVLLGEWIDGNSRFSASTTFIPLYVFFAYVVLVISIIGFTQFKKWLSRVQADL